MDRVPSNHRLAERKLIAMVRAGEWEIDNEGRIWRVCITSSAVTGTAARGGRVATTTLRRTNDDLP